MKIQYFGHSCFTVESNGYVIGFDPYDPETPGYEPLHIDVNAVYCSHGHGDHNYLPAVSLSGSDKKDPFKITEFEIPHDDAQGSKRGMNLVRICEAEGKKFAHFGDIGCMPSEEQYAMLEGCDFVLIPVGGFFTIDHVQAEEIVNRIAPKMAVAMHFRRGKYGYDQIDDISGMKLSEVFTVMEYGEVKEV